MATFLIRVVWSDGTEEYLKSDDRPAVFRSKRAADEQAAFMKMGMDDGEAQICVVKGNLASAK